MRPLFPKGFTNEVQVIATVVSLNPDVDPDIPALLGASAALAISGMPFAGPIGAAKVGYKDGNYILNPGVAALAESQLELVVAGTADAVLMVESEAKGLPEDVMLGAVMFGHEQMQLAINAINELAAEVGKPAWDWQAVAADSALDSAVTTAARKRTGSSLPDNGQDGAPGERGGSEESGHRVCRRRARVIVGRRKTSKRLVQPREAHRP